MEHYCFKKYRFTDYAFHCDDIANAAGDFNQIFGVGPNILAANQCTFDRMEEVTGSTFEYVEACSSDDGPEKDDFEKLGGVHPQSKQRGLSQGGYICSDFGVLYHLDEAIDDDEFELRYIEWVEP